HFAVSFYLVDAIAANVRIAGPDNSSGFGDGAITTESQNDHGSSESGFSGRLAFSPIGTQALQELLGSKLLVLSQRTSGISLIESVTMPNISPAAVTFQAAAPSLAGIRPTTTIVVVLYYPVVVSEKHSISCCQRRGYPRIVRPGEMTTGTKLDAGNLRAENTVPPELEYPAAANLIRRTSLLIILCCLLLSGCRSGTTNTAPTIELIRIPLEDEGGTGKMAAIEGRVTGARPGQQIVLFARSGAWYVQPFTEQPFTKIQPDSTWRNSTHLGTEYAAMLVEPEYRPPAVTDVLPNRGGGVIAVAVAPGEAKLLLPVFWQTWWFRLLGGLACLFALLAFHRLRLRQLARQLNARFDERLEERTRIAQDLHDTLLQGFLSASMQLYVAVEQLPEDSPAKSRLNQVHQLMGRVIEEGRNTVQGLRSI